VKIVFNSSPLIFLSRLGFLDRFLNATDNFYLPKVVAEEIGFKTDDAFREIQNAIDAGKLTVRSIQLTGLANGLNQRLGKGESEAIALGIELHTDYIILDDFAARKEAIRLGLKVKGTLAIVKKLRDDRQITVTSLEQLYDDLQEIDFRVKRSLFDAIFGE